ncbi:MAG: HAMP domain-containing histidine kinase [Tannerella sp.]|jgi:signal transduction histidine kinase|nr:HAMP domain-containing histidine kinase [Tannerella sp.]
MRLNKYKYRLALKIIWLVITSGAVAYCISRQWYWAGGGCAVFFAVAVKKLSEFQYRTFKDMRRLIDAIQFSELNITFKYLIPKGLAPELVPEMEKAVAQFNLRQRKYMSEQIFYDLLLNRIDFGVIVVEGKGDILWLNKWITDLFVSPYPKRLADFAKLAPELPEILENIIPNETKLLSINNIQVAATAIYFYSENKRLKVISLKNVKAVLEESENDAWRKLIRVLTHEMMNSLTPIISLSETFSEENPDMLQTPVLEDSFDTPDDGGFQMMKRAMQTIHRRSKGLVTFVSNYRKLAQIPQPVKAPFDAIDWIEDISRLLAPDGYRFVYSVNPPKLIINADRALLEQALINLIRNACESSAQQPDVNVEIERDGYNRLYIRVKDTGDGILPEVMDRIFVPFFTTKPSGSGIGLSICRQIVKLHGGTISVYSQSGEGSCFTIVI